MPSQISSRSDLPNDNFFKWKIELVDGCHCSSEDQLAILFEVCKGKDGLASVKKLFEEMSKTGIRRNDPRLSESLLELSSSVHDERLDFSTFKSVLSENIVIISKVFQNQLVVPAFEAFCESLTTIFNECRSNRSGERADHIPQLADQDPETWGLSICTVDGQRFSIGDAKKPFTMQALSMPFMYGLTLKELGEQVVHKYQGREPSGRSSNEIVLDHNNKPHNPLINSGALLSSSLILDLVQPQLKNMAEKYDFTFNLMQKMAGNETMEFNNSAFLAEQTSTDRDYALAYFMRENHCFPGDTEANIKSILEFYFQMLCLEVTCESSSVMAATLANSGTCPITGEKLLSFEAVNHTLDMMYSCGMNIYSGQFAFNCGLPAMSAISGAIMLVVPRVMGIMLWSPCLDRFGNSERGVQFCRELVAKYAFHRFDGVGAVESKLNPTAKKATSNTNILFQAMLAAACNDVPFLRRLYLREFDLNASNYDGRTALHVAAAEGHMETVQFLLERAEVEPNPKDRWHQTPLSEAYRLKRSEVLAFIKDYLHKHPEKDVSRHPKAHGLRRQRKSVYGPIDEV